MGNTTSQQQKPKLSVHDAEHFPRPGYYYRQGNKNFLYRAVQTDLLENEEFFQKLGYGYAKTNKRVFYKGVVIPGAHPTSFHVVTRTNVKTISKFPEKNTELVKLNTVLGVDFVNHTKRIYHRNVIVHEE